VDGSVKPLLHVDGSVKLLLHVDGHPHVEIV
jgi:hypothetical protein